MAYYKMSLGNMAAASLVTLSVVGCDRLPFWSNPLETKVAEQQGQIAKLTADNAKLVGENKSYRDADYTNQIGKLRSQVTGLEDEKTGYTGEIQKLQSQVSRLESEKAHYTGDNQRLLGRVLALEAQNQSLEGKVGEKTHELAEVRGLYGALQEKIRPYETEIARLKLSIELRQVEKMYTGVDFPLEIDEIFIGKNSNLWEALRNFYREHFSIELDDQRCRNGRSRDFGIFIYRREEDIADNFPQQPKAAQRRLGNLNKVFEDDRFLVWAPKEAPSMTNNCN